MTIVIAPFVNYSFTVAGCTSIGIGPSSRPLNFTTMEDGLFDSAP